MSCNIKPVRFKELVIHIYDFDEVGDTLPMHKHTDQDDHITIVTRGKLKAYGPDYEIEVNSGDILDWEPNQLHEFIALEPNSRIVNVNKNFAYMMKQDIV